MKKMTLLSAYALVLLALPAFGPCCRRTSTESTDCSSCTNVGGGIATFPKRMYSYDADEAAGYAGDKEIAAIVQREAAMSNTAQ